VVHGDIESKAVRRGKAAFPGRAGHIRRDFIARMHVTFAIQRIIPCTVRLISVPIDGLSAHIFGEPFEGIHHAAPHLYQHVLGIVLALNRYSNTAQQQRS
jgi:hypothetical protein